MAVGDKIEEYQGKRGRLSSVGHSHSQPQLAGSTFISIVPSKGPPIPKFGELFQYRELLHLVVRRELVVCYEQTVMGAASAIIQPILCDDCL